MSNVLLIRGAQVVSSTGVIQADVLVRDGRIAAVEPSLSDGADEVIDAAGLHLLPGVLDPHVHFREPGGEWKEDLESGSRAAAAGGVTGFFDMPNTSPHTVSRAAVAEKKAFAAARSLVNYNFFIGATANNLEELNTVENVPGIKIFMAASTGNLLLSDREQIERIFASGDRPIVVHSEDEATIQANRERYADSVNPEDHMRIHSADAALEATRFLVRMAKKHNRRVHILHLTTRQEVEFLREEGKDGLVGLEVCPQHFFLRAPDDYERLGTYAQMNPPIRSPGHGDALWSALTDGVIDWMATDHAPHTHEEKQKPFGQAPSGMPGVETALPLMLNRANSGECAVSDVVKWMCEKPVQFYGVSNKGRVSPGYDADLVLVDMNESRTIRNGELHTRCNWSPYDGWTLQGWPVLTVVNGIIVYREGEFISDRKGREIQISQS